LVPFLQDLDITEEDRNKLAQLTKLGAKSPRALLALRKASPEAFDNLIGSDRVADVISALRSVVSEEDLRDIDAQSTWRPSTGARLGRPPGR
jgi:hypothetical protein